MPIPLQGTAMTALLSPSPAPPRGILPIAILLSILVHILLLIGLGRESISGPRPPEEIVVSLQSPALQEPLAANAPAPIVAPSDQENGEVPEGRAFRSDRNNRVEQETIARGIPNPGLPEGTAEGLAPEAPPPQPPAAAQESTAQATAPPAPEAADPASDADRRNETQKMLAAPDTGTQPARELPGLEKLLAPPGTVLGNRPPPQPRAASQAPPGAAVPDPNRDLLRAPPPARGLLAGLRGTYDNLPSVAAGKLTFLNTKADRFAPFVRRVGTRVFENLLIEQRKRLNANEILAARNSTTVRVLLSPEGKLKDIEIVERSGSQSMDGTLLEALRAAAFDANPPREASKEDGTYEFIFRAQVLAQVGSGSSGPKLQRVESRLQVGLN
jgi:TonB family protein